jgi:uroporphyrinogen III methyltransferase/synthase
MAEAIVYDALISWELERLFPQGARRVFVGKRSSRHTLPQEEINRLLVRLANEEGLRVVRLKGGDPFVFGRGGEEALALKEAGVPFEVVPGVSSAFAVPAYSGIPVTHRKVASTVAIVTGHEDPSKPAGHLDFHALASFDTIVFLMALHSLEHNVCKLIEAGKDASAPAALIQAGTTSRQRTLLAPLEEIPKIASRRRLALPPCSWSAKSPGFTNS